jgi:hypothetical protein
MVVWKVVARVLRLVDYWADKMVENLVASKVDQKDALLAVHWVVS